MIIKSHLIDMYIKIYYVSMLISFKFIYIHTKYIKMIV